MLKVNITYVGHPRTVRRVLNQAVADGCEQAIFAWHRETAPGHFEHGAERKYHYENRRIPWAKRKTPPLVKTGLSKRQLLRAVKVTKKATKGHAIAKGNFKAPRYWWMIQRRKDGKVIDKAAEALRTLKSESDPMARVVDKHIERRVNAETSVVRKRIG